MAECWDGSYDHELTRRVLFAATAWETATGPVMAPGYVRYHARVRRARLECNWWDATLAGLVDLVVPWTAPLARSSDWQCGAWWRDWPSDSLGGEEYFHEPGDEDRSQYPYLLTTAQLLFPLPGLPLPAAPSGPDEAVTVARETVGVLVAALNDVVTPVIETLERS